MKKYTLFPIAVFLLCSLSASAQDYTPQFEKFTLRNGLSVVLHRDTTLPLISLNMAYHAGSAIDPEGRTGLANIAGEMLLLGTKKVPREELLRLRNEEHASISALTTVDWVGIASVFPMNRLETAIMIEADRMEHSVDAFTREQWEGMVAGLKKEHARRAKQALGTLTQQVFHELYADGHPYRHNSIGEISDVDSIRFDDVTTFSRRYHVPANAYLTIGGNFNPTKARALVEKYFSKISAGQPAGWANIPDSFVPLGQGAFIVEDRIGFNQLHLVFPTVRAGHPDEPILKLIAKLLTGSEHALLYSNLVKVNPLVHSVEVSQSSNELTGTLWITITCKLETHLTTVYTQVMRILDALASEGVSDDELTAARNQSAMEFYTPLETFYGFGGRCDVLNLGNLLGDSPLFSFALQQNQLQATSASVRRATGTYLSTGNQLVVSVVPIGKADFAVSIK
ncbi:MAG: insulinase family protein [Bacteroidetes bacterium]|nr:insulinase family protein [Bacteroidota bacterium]